MNYYFTAKTNEIRADFDNIRIFSMVDSANSEYIICFKDLTTGLAEVKVFNFDYGRWDYSHGYPVQWGESMKTVLMSTDGEQLYLHNTGAASTMYGEYYTPWLRFIFNAESKFVKRVDSLGLRTDGQWRLSGLRTLANQTYPEMTSEIPANGFVYQEGIAWADYFRDSSNIVARLPYLRTAELALMNGRELRSIAFDHTIELVSTDANSIVSATIIYEDSRPAV